MHSRGSFSCYEVGLGFIYFTGQHDGPVLWLTGIWGAESSAGAQDAARPETLGVEHQPQRRKWVTAYTFSNVSKMHFAYTLSSSAYINEMLQYQSGVNPLEFLVNLFI